MTEKKADQCKTVKRIPLWRSEPAMTPEQIRRWLDEYEAQQNAVCPNPPHCQCDNHRLGVALRHLRAMSLEIEAAHEEFERALPYYGTRMNTLSERIRIMKAWAGDLR